MDSPSSSGSIPCIHPLPALLLLSFQECWWNTGESILVIPKFIWQSGGNGSQFMLSPLSVNIRVVLGNGRHSMAEHHIGIVKGLLHLHGTIWTPANIIIWRTKERHYDVGITQIRVSTFKGNSNTCSSSTLTWLERVLDVEHWGPVAIHQIFLDLIFSNVTTPIFYPDARFQVVEVAAVQLKEFDKQNANVDVRTAHIFSVVELENTVWKISDFIIDRESSLVRQNYIKRLKWRKCISDSFWWPNLSDLQEADSHEEETVGPNPTSKNLIEVSLQQELFKHQDQVRQYRVFLQNQRNRDTWLKTVLMYGSKQEV